MLRVHGLSKSFASRSGPRPVLQALDLSLATSSGAIIVGDNGSGKSTLLKCLVGVIRPDAGQVMLGDVPIASQRSAVSFVFDTAIASHSRLRAMEAVRYLLAVSGKLSRNSEDRAGSILSALRLTDFHAEVQRLSRGNQQKINIAVGMASSPNLLVCDEPTSFLDTGAIEVFAGLLKEFVRAGACALVTTHDKAFVKALDFGMHRLHEGRLTPVREQLADVVVSDRLYVKMRNDADFDEIAADMPALELNRLSPTEFVAPSSVADVLLSHMRRSRIVELKAIQWDCET